MTRRCRQSVPLACPSRYAAGHMMILLVVLLPLLCRADTVTRDAEGRYQATYKQRRVATNYAFVVDSRLDAIEAEYWRIRRDAKAGPSPSASLEARVAAAIKSLEARGAWVEKGRLQHHKVEPESGIIDGRTFIDNVKALCAFLQVTHER